MNWWYAAGNLLNSGSAPFLEALHIVPLGVAANGGSFVVKHLEHSVELRDLKQVLDPFRQV